MADRLKPENKEIVERIRIFEKELFKEQKFKVYRNYHVPENFVKKAKKVLSFGVGGDANFEKLICFDNLDLDVRLYDPTPYTIKNIKQIIEKGGYRQFNEIPNANSLNQQIIKNNLKFMPLAYAPNNGKMKFYYKTEPGAKRPEQALGSFSLAGAFDNPDNFVEVDCKNIQTILADLNWNSVDILKTDVEGLWYDVGLELQNIDCKFWVSEMELGLGGSFDESFDKIRKLCEIHKDKYNFYINRKRLKAMMEVIFFRKDCDES